MVKQVPAWFENAVMYEIYPQSFCDSNGDGIGDLRGIISKLDYVKSLGVDGIWLNPCFDSPFQDAGYDVRDYRKVAERYGTNDDLKLLFAEAHRRGLRILLDLVPGHTSVQHEWFRAAVSGQETPCDDYYVFTQGPDEPQKGYPFICGYGDRDGYYMINFFYSQPALNYGFSDPDPECLWQKSTDDPGVRLVREEIRQVMKFWLDAGCDGFRVDMAFSLVKGKEHRDEKLMELWQDYSSWMKKEYPEAVLIAEGGRPMLAYDCGFDSDFFLSWGNPDLANKQTFRNESYLYHTNIRKSDSRKSYFAPESSGNSRLFTKELEEVLAHDGGLARFSVVTGNHDLTRIRRGRSIADVKVAFTFIFTLPGRPFLYYGDEIGMDYLAHLGNKEGAYSRSGDRSPMQWEPGVRAGFSTAAPEKFYLPLDPDPGRPCVAAQESDPDSLLNYTRKLIALRHEHPALGAAAAYRTLLSSSDSAPLLYLREQGAEKFLIVINPDRNAAEVTVELETAGVEPVLISGSIAVTAGGGKITAKISGVSAGIFRI